MDNSPWIALVGPFPHALRPSTRWRDRYQRAPRAIAANDLAGALIDAALDGVIVHWDAPDRLDIAADVAAAGQPLCLPGPLTPGERGRLAHADQSSLLGAPSHALPAVRAMSHGVAAGETGPVRYVSVRRLTRPAPAARHYAPLTDALTAAATLIDDTPVWVFAQAAHNAGADTIVATVHFAAAEAMATWVQTPEGPAHDDWLLYGTKSMLRQRDETADHTLAAHLFDHWLGVRTGRDEPLLCAEQALTAAQLASAVARSVHENRRVAWQEVAVNG